MELAGFPENGSLGFCFSDIDSLKLLEEVELLPDLDSENATFESLHCPDLCYDSEEKPYEDAWYLCPNTEYSGIDIIDYVLEDKQNGLLEEILNGIASDNKEYRAEQNIKKCKKRSFLSKLKNQPDASQPKRRKLGPKTVVKIKPYPQNERSSKGSGSFPTEICFPRILPSAQGIQSAVPVQLSFVSPSPAGKTFVTPVATTDPMMTMSTRGVHVMPTFTSLPPQIVILSPGNSLPHLVIYTVCPSSNTSKAHASRVAPVMLPAGCTGDTIASSIPSSPHRGVSSSPFAPSAADLPNLPEPARVDHCVISDLETFGHQTQTSLHISEKAVEIPKSVDTFRTLLKEHYREKCKFLMKNSRIALDSLYTEVSLVESQIEPKAGKSTAKASEKEFCIYDSSERERSAVVRSDLFKMARGKKRETKKIALLGQAGMGKSVLVKKVCQDWSSGKFSEFTFVFWFKCRKMNLPGRRYSLKDLLFQLFLKPEENSEEVFKYILCNPEKVLLIFDGFDEFQDADGLMHCSVGLSAEQSHTIKELLAGLLQKKLLSGCTVLITAMPKDKFSQYLAKVDKIVEAIGFSPSQIEEYLEKHFKMLPHCTHAVKLIKECQYLFSYCFNPFLCNLICCLCEKMFQADQKLPVTLTNLFLKDLQHALVDTTMNPTSDQVGNQQCIAKLAHAALTFGQKHQQVLRYNQFPSEEVKNFALKHGFMLPFCTHPENGCEELGGVFCNSVAQMFWGALHLTLSTDVKDKNLMKYISLETKKKRPQDSWQDMIRRFLSGLLFLKDELHLNFDSKRDIKSNITRKQKIVSKYLTELEANELGPSKFLELCHCVYETQNGHLLQHLASALPEELSFLTTRLTPPDVFVLLYILKSSIKKFSLDLRNCVIDLYGLKQLVSVDNIVLFRASLSDTVKHLESLQESGEHELLRLFIEKFTIDPFKAKTMKDIVDLTALVHVQENMQNGMQGINEIPAIRALKKLEFTLGPIHGPEGFLKLAEILPAFSSLQHLDLDENNIGNRGVEKLSDVFPKLTLLKMLNLAQNNITDEGAKKLMKGLPSLSSLQILCLYNNYICDSGAEDIAEILPVMTSLKELALQYNRITDHGAQKITDSLKKCPQITSVLMWNPAIPHGVLEHLQQKDSRIKF
ncbi:MHC class II transactivator [Microcaecilia unicolor]|uniref:MHC class II transactivator n=1 Tax=Microcaecilia unicolor TaxID=1415580 RepID=A0A6P7YPM0_9AMPH|nr:MHC class II transactivator [Microcaecilia unicolor]